ncbi:MAG: hypothetical protein HYZ29_20405 [Myxococcales bacterium]|nr:hypothetical protein [Myxococcales bacterium]
MGACSSDEPSPGGTKCTPGQSAPCACTSGQTGAQICQGDGTFAGCVCGGSGGGAGQAGGGTGGQSTGGGAGQPTGGTGGSGPGESLTGEWSKVFPGDYEIAALAVDSAGTLIVAGTSGGPVDFGNGPVGKSMTGWARQLLITGFDASGQRKFAFATDAGRINSRTLSIRPVAQDRIVVQGETTVTSQGSYPSVKYTLVWPCGTAPSSIGSAIHFVVELDQTGKCIWDHTYPADGYSQLPTAVVSPKDGSVFVTAIEQWEMPMTRRYLADGTEAWQKPFGGSALAALNAGHVLLASYDPLKLPSGTVSGLFALAKLDSAGGVVAGTAWGTSGYEPTRQLVGFDVGGSDRVALALRYTGTVDLGGGPRTSTDAGASPSRLFAMFEASLSHVFSISIDEPKSDSGKTNPWDPRVVVTDTKAIYTGQFWRTVNFGAGSLQAVGTSDTDFDIFVASYGFNGTPAVARRFGGPGSDGVRAVAKDGAGAVYLSGWFNTSVNFGDAAHGLPSDDSGVPDPPTYLVKLRP